MLRVLILGGTSEGRQLAAALHGCPDIAVISSLAGRVTAPRLPSGEVRIGGFGGAAGLVDWLRSHEIAAVIDATHPFATQISSSAVSACGRLGVALLVLQRPGWCEQDGDVWHRVPSVAGAAELLPQLGRRVFLTTGRQDLAPFAGLDGLWFLIRTVDPAAPPVPLHSVNVLARGPFDVADELALMRHHHIDVLVTKDSGGSLTAAKLAAARELAIPVVMVDRPARPQLESVASVEDATAWLATLVARARAQDG